MHTYAVYKIKLLLRCGSNVFIYLQFDDCIFCNGYCMIIICYVFIYRCQSIVTASLKITALTLPCYALGFYRRCTSWFLCLEKKPKGERCPSFHCLLKNTKTEWNVKSHIFYKGSTDWGEGGYQIYSFLINIFASKIKIWYKRNVKNIFFRF